MADSQETILARLLETIPDTQDTRESTVTYQILSAAAMEFQSAYEDIENTLNETYADTASYEGLSLRGQERGLTPLEATKAELKATFNTTNVSIGDRFFAGDFTYIVIRSIEGDDHSKVLQCEQEGENANSYIGSIIPVQDIEGLTSANIVELLIPGENEETEENFRKRYFDSFNNNTYGWNVAMYKSYVVRMQGVSGVIVLPSTNASGQTEFGNVKLVIQGADYGLPTQAVLTNIKEELDPNGGDGTGIVSIDQTVHVASCGQQQINISTTITYQSGYTFEQLEDDIKNAVDEYLYSLNKKWSDEQVVVRIAQLESHILNVTGVLDIENTKINGESSSYPVDRYSIAIRGDISA